MALRKATSRAAAGGLLLLLVTVSVAAQDFLGRYRQGLEAMEAERWEEAARALGQAIAERPQESARIPLRFYFKSYLPFYFLGRARFELGDCPAALAAWDESERQGVVQRFPEYEVLQAERWTCRQRLESEESARAAAIGWSRLRVAEAQERAQALADRDGDPDVRRVWEEDSSLAGRRREAEALLDRARRRLAEQSEVGAVEEIRRAGEMAARAGEELEAAGRRVEVLASERSAERREALREIEELAAAGRRELEAASFLAPYPPGIARRRDDLESALAAAGAAAEEPQRLEELRQALADAVARFRRSVAPPPRKLQEAARALFAADYPQVLEILRDIEMAEPRAAAQAHLFQAAARFALYALGGESDPELLASVRRHILSCRQADPGLEPLPRAFSPRFREIFATTVPPPPGG